MNKRSFRPTPAEPPAYPTDDELQARDRRQLLQRLAALLGLGLLFPGTALAGDKAKKKDEKKKEAKKKLRPPGVAPHPHAALDEQGDTPDNKKKPDSKKPSKKPDKKPDLPPPGVPPHPHAAIDE